MYSYKSNLIVIHETLLLIIHRFVMICPMYVCYVTKEIRSLSRIIMNGLIHIPRIVGSTPILGAQSRIIFSEKSLSVPIPCVRVSVCPSRPVPSRPVTKKVTKTENFTEQSCQMYSNGDKNTFRIKLMPLQCWARQS